MLREAGVKLLLHSFVDEVMTRDGAIEHVVVTNKSGRTPVAGASSWIAAEMPT